MRGHGLAPRRLLLVAVILAAAACFAAVQLSAAERIRAENAWVPSAPPTIKVHAAYMTIVNESNEEQAVVSVESPDYERAELHSSSVVNGVTQMRHVDQLAIPANKRVAL